MPRPRKYNYGRPRYLGPPPSKQSSPRIPEVRQEAAVPLDVQTEVVKLTNKALTDGVEHLEAASRLLEPLVKVGWFKANESYAWENLGRLTDATNAFKSLWSGVLKSRGLTKEELE